MRDKMTSHLEKMRNLPTWELDQILQAELKEKEPDEEVVLSVLNVLRDREDQTEMEIDENILAAWEDFPKTPVCFEKKPVARKGKRKEFKRKIVAFAIAACLTAVVIPVAFGKEGWFTVVAKWTRDFLSFSEFKGDKGNNTYVFKSDNPDLQKMHEEITELGVVGPVVPTWLPEGFTLESAKVIPVQAGSKYVAYFLDGNDSVILSYTKLSQKDNYYEKIEGAVETYEIQGIEHYIASNQESFSAIWFNNCECSIVTTLEKNDLVKILNSIYKG